MPTPSNDQFKIYVKKFVRRSNRYVVQNKQGKWSGRSYPLSDKVIQQHLDKEIMVASRGRLYPEYAAFDFDNVKIQLVERIRAERDMDLENSRLFTSRSVDSYHLYFRPTYNGEPLTLDKLETIFKTYVHQTPEICGVFPQKRQCFRLPVGRGQKCVDFGYEHIENWQDHLYWFDKIDEYDLASVPHQRAFDFKAMPGASGLKVPATETDIFKCSTYYQGRDLFKHGLQAKRTRNNSQFKVIFYLWCENTPPDETIRSVWAWISKHHNEQSETFLKHPAQVKKDIGTQVAKVYTDYEHRNIYPDTVHNAHKGFLCALDLPEIVQLGGGNLPKIKFIAQMVQHFNPRRSRNKVSLHSEHLRKWSTRSYIRHLEFLDTKGILTRAPGYRTGEYSKAITFNWDYKNISDAIVNDQGRAVNTFEGAVSAKYTPSEFQSMIMAAGAERTAAWHATRGIFDKLKV